MGKTSCRSDCLRWLVCFSAWCTEFITMGLFFSFGTIFVALVTEYKASETLAAWIGSLSYCVFHVSSTIVQVFSRYIGFREMGCLGGFLFGIGLLLSSFVKQSSWLLLSYGITIGLGCGLARFSALFALPRYFATRTSVAIGVSLSGYGVGAIGMGYLTEYVYSHYGLPATFRILALFGILLMICSLSFRPIASKLELALKKREHRSNLSPIKLLKNRYMLAHCIAFWLYCFGLYIPNVHLVYMAENANVPSLMATFLPSSMAVAQSIGRVIFGHLASTNKISPVISCQITMFFCSMATTFCPLANSFAAFMTYAVAVGFLDSCSTIMALKIIQDLLGVDGLSSGYALQMTGTGISAAIGPAVAGFLYEFFGSYIVPFAIAGAFQTSCVCILFLVSTKKKHNDCILDKEKMSLIKDNMSYQNSTDSGIDSACKELNGSEQRSGGISLPTDEESDLLSQYQFEACHDKLTGKVTSKLKMEALSRHKEKLENVLIIERETVL